METTNTVDWKYPVGETSKGADNQTLITDKDGYQYEIPERRTIQNVFKFESDDLDQILRGAHPGNTGATE